MKLFNALLSAGIFLLSVTGPVVNASEAKYERGVDEKADAEYDIQMGLAGLKQAANDPKLLAQLMQDLQVRMCFNLLRSHSRILFHDENANH